MTQSPCIAVVSALVAAGCQVAEPVAADTEVGERTLVTVDGWAPASWDVDALAAERPAEVDCPDWGYGGEDGTFEVLTDICRYGAFEQELLEPVSAGDQIAVELWHLDLWAPEQAEAHIAVGIEQELLWEMYLAIPGQADTHQHQVEVAQDAAAGDVMWLHVHNHGTNSYNFYPFVASAP